jgi:NAD(P)-dependent dehydrogenase (short-subunit alcohol dehydrogenase family)
MYTENSKQFMSISPDTSTSAGIAGPLLRDQTVLVTGAAGGIGRIVSRVLNDAAARLVLVDRPGPALDELAAALGEGAEVRALDATDPGQVRALVAETEAGVGPIDGLVNCAGLWEVAPWQDISDASWQAVVDGNLRSAFVCCQSVLPGMVERRGGAIVNFASTAGEYGSISPAAHYAAAKGGVIALTKSLAREVGEFNVRVNAISPGPTDTVALGAATAEDKARVGRRTLLGRLAQPEEMAHGVLYLVGPLSTFVTGHVLRVNGGSLL